ncbi:MAG TPA: protein phosphatase CheZ [Burkholderiales bacterium]|nr:protein phosphatase CheZ [Burkholderiales bacterium]
MISRPATAPCGDGREEGRGTSSGVTAGGDPESSSAAAQPAAHPEQMLARIGQLTRLLHDNLRELGYDRQIETAASSIPDARDRLTYIATLTEQAAQRALNAIETARPIQQALAAEATRLNAQWESVLRREAGVDDFRALLSATRDFLASVSARSEATNAQLLEILMAQDFQDLTGQVIKKITEIIQMVETQLLALLVESLPPARRSEEANLLLNGPVIQAAGRSDVVTSQAQVDDLLESLGF